MINALDLLRTLADNTYAVIIDENQMSTTLGNKDNAIWLSNHAVKSVSIHNNDTLYINIIGIIEFAE